MTDSPVTSAPRSDRVRLRRKRERGRHDRATIDAILDEALVAHLGIVDAQGRPLVIPTLHARHGDQVYVHGSAASRTMRAISEGAPLCLTVSLIDGLVLARSALHHSANYRSVMLLGTASPIEQPARKREALRVVIEHIIPGRWDDVRPPSDNELKATAVLAIAIDEASAKIRSGQPEDEPADHALGAWAGVLPLATEARAPVPDPLLRPGIPLPAYAASYRRPAAPRPRR